MHAALALDGLEQHGADVGAALGKDGAQGLDVVGVDGHEAAGQRLERVLRPALHCGRDGLHRAAVEALVEADDVVATVAAALGVQARELDGALVGLGAGVAKERAPELRFIRGGRGGLALAGVGGLREHTGHLAPVLDLEVVGDVQQLGHLAAHGRVERGVVVAQTVHGDAGKEVEVVVALVVGEVHAVATHELDRRAAERVHHVGVVELLGLFVRHVGSFRGSCGARRTGRAEGAAPWASC